MKKVVSEISDAPAHVAIIMDGNGRWAEEQGKRRIEGHRAGVRRIRPVVRMLAKRGVKFATLYAFSTENWNRPQSEVDGIMGILRDVIDEQTAALNEQNVRLVHIGRKHGLQADVSEAVERAERVTRGNTGLTLCLAFDYGGRGEIVDAVKRIIADSVSLDAIDEATLSRYLYTDGVPDPDLIIRTAGEYRLSNFLLWQSAYSEFFTTAALWPDLSAAHIDEAFEAYRNRRRRFGALAPQS